MSFSYEEFKSDWRAMLQTIDGGRYDNNSSDMVREMLDTYYGEPWRHYHTTEHLNSFQLALRALGCYSNAVRIAGYFHDIIWLPGYPQCEERSAELAEAVLYSIGARIHFVEDVKRLILATKHTGKPPADEAEAQIRDADLWTLGEPEQHKFLKTQREVRDEFAHVPEELYQTTRKRLFQNMFVDRIYWTPLGRTREAQAVRNLQSVGIELLKPGECTCPLVHFDSVHVEVQHGNGSTCVRGYSDYPPYRPFT